ncbi:UDP-glycosyltransferase UGT5-like isoform X2 [Diabrotica virgifera virgifera]|uniref:UDP-glucuronosyltransferase n=1 Tax=Diabrotica virgifera virgifera TaxID=50390 RepID=A0A6P7F3Q3_DIAVI|nr:UDP-glycosyltransferase UGT5-like isoform X2 [Diabrotica virgifera virgifera]
MWIGSLLLVISALCSVQGYNFLAIFPHPGSSHFKVFAALFEELIKKGHNVTLVASLPYKNTNRNITVVDLSNDLNFNEFMILGNPDVDTRMSRYFEFILVFFMADITCRGISSNAFQSLLKTTEKFDAILLEDFNTDCYMRAASKFKVPIIAMSSSGILPWSWSRYGSPINPSISPNIMLPLTDKMTFLERVENTIVTVVDNLIFKYHRREKDRQVVKRNLSDVSEDLENYDSYVSLMLANVHYTLTSPRQLAPNVIEVGGLHIKNPKPLPMDLKKWIEDSPEGVIYFCMGSMTKGHTFPKRQREAFLQAFDLLPYRVLWKYENESMEGKSDKILLRKWLPQLDVLCHPNVKLFISHGGMLGTMEAVYCGVPILVMPQFGDQFSNAVALEANGGGIMLRTSDVTEESAYRSIRQAIKMKDQAIALSERFKDRPLPPLDTAVYWTEYVVKHKGAPFMKTAAADMPFYQYYLLDVLGFIFVILGLIIYLTVYMTRLILRMILRVSSKKVKTQ